MLDLVNYSLKIKNKELLSNVTVHFESGVISHILGKNGVGKSQFAKDFLLNNTHSFSQTITKGTTIISSFSTIPEDLKVKDLFKILKNKFNENQINDLAALLKIEKIDTNMIIGKLSDGQKQKLKILSFFLEDKQIIILDELTNALDKQTVLDIYVFLNDYIATNQEKYLLNITHNLSDLKHLPGNLYLLEDLQLNQYESVEEVTKKYID